MKSLTPLSALEGHIVHGIIESLIQQHRLGRSLKSSPAQELYSQKVGDYKKTARDTVVESFNGLVLTDRFFDLIEKDGKQQISNFVNIVWPHLEDLEYLMHEKFESFAIEGIKVNVRVDYVTRSPNGKVVVTDWKTGEEGRFTDANLQMIVYGMWASSKYGTPLSNVMLELAYLRKGESRPVQIDEDDVSSATEIVLATVSEILASETLEDFPTNPDRDRCLGCAFACVCPDGTTILKDFIGEPV